MIALLFICLIAGQQVQLNREAPNFPAIIIATSVAVPLVTLSAAWAMFSPTVSATSLDRISSSTSFTLPISLRTSEPLSINRTLSSGWTSLPPFLLVSRPAAEEKDEYIPLALSTDFNVSHEYLRYDDKLFHSAIGRFRAQRSLVSIEPAFVIAPPSEPRQHAQPFSVSYTYTNESICLLEERDLHRKLDDQSIPTCTLDIDHEKVSTGQRIFVGNASRCLAEERPRDLECPNVFYEAATASREQPGTSLLAYLLYSIASIASSCFIIRVIVRFPSFSFVLMKRHVLTFVSSTAERF